VSQCDSDTPALSGKTFALSPAAEAALSQCDKDGTVALRDLPQWLKDNPLPDTLDPHPAVLPSDSGTSFAGDSFAPSGTAYKALVVTKALLAETPSRQMQECERLAKHILTRFGSEKPDILEVARQLRNWRYGGR
jgi:hypothetical protein